jgi:DNA-binding response OmpR family regulator
MAEVWIVDDEKDLLELLAYNFERAGFKVTTFSLAEPALERLTHQKPDIILSDWMMPGMNGLEFCQKIKQHHLGASIPFFMVTCKSSGDSAQEAISYGVDEFISKPFRIQELINRVQARIAG